MAGCSRGLGRALGASTRPFEAAFPPTVPNVAYTEQRDQYWRRMRTIVDSLSPLRGDMREALEFIATAPESRDWPLDVYAPLAKCI